MTRSPRSPKRPARMRSRHVERLESRSLLAADLDSSLARFGSVEALQDYLIEDGLRRYESLFGTDTGWGCWNLCYPHVLFDGAEVSEYRMLASSANTADFSSANHSVSGTNVQVAGIDEGDLVETDGRSLFALGGSRLSIVDVTRPDSLSLLSQVDLPGVGVAEFLIGDRLTVISTESYWSEALPLMTLRAAEGFSPYPYLSASPSVTVTVFDVSDPTSPRELEQTKLDGAYRDSRAIDDKVLVVVDNSQLSLPAPSVTCEETPVPFEDDGSTAASDAQASSRMSLMWPPPEYVGSKCVYESKDAWLERMSGEVDTYLVERLPHFTSYGADHEFARAGLLHEPSDLVRPTSPDASQILSLVTFDVDDADPGVLASEGVVAGWNSAIYVSRDAVIIVEPTWDSVGTQGAQSRLLLYRWNDDLGAPIASAVGLVPGSLVNSFALDVHQGIVRVATTTSAWSDKGTWSSNNHLFTLRVVGQKLEVVGELDEFGVDERIQSVRFQGDIAYVVTFRQTDPLFTIDLSDPASPRLLGELVLPGFSGYLQQLDATHLLGMGYAPQADGRWSSQLSLFDIADLAAPRLLDTFALPVSSWSLANGDHHALLWNATTHVLTLPLSRSEPDGTTTTVEGYSWENYRQVHELLALRIDDPASGQVGDRFEKLGTVEHDSPVRRGVTIDDRLYSLASADLKLAAALPGTASLDSLELFVWPEPYQPWFVEDSLPVGALVRIADTQSEEAAPADVTPTPLDDDGLAEALSLAREDLAARRAIRSQSIRFVGAEPALDEPTESGLVTFQIVLAIGDVRYLYRADASGRLELLDDAFEFADQPEHSPWTNSRNSLDASNDGHVAPQDALIVINELNAGGARELRAQFPLRAIATPTSDLTVSLFWDVDGDRFLAPIDALRIINWLNQNQAAGEGEAILGTEALATGEYLAPIEVPAQSVPRRAVTWATAVDATVACVEPDSPWWEL